MPKTTTKIEFEIEQRAARYLSWYAANILLVKDHHEAAQYLVQRGIEQMRREHRGSEPSIF